jgi:hypothetical protein
MGRAICLGAFAGGTRFAYSFVAARGDATDILSRVARFEASQQSRKKWEAPPF